MTIYKLSIYVCSPFSDYGYRCVVHRHYQSLSLVEKQIKRLEQEGFQPIKCDGQTTNRVLRFLEKSYTKSDEEILLVKSVAWKWKYRYFNFNGVCILPKECVIVCTKINVKED